MKYATKHLAAGAASLFLALVAFSLHGQSLTASNLTRIDFEQKLGAQVSLDLPFRDEQGRSVRLGSYFGKPVILVLGYYECPMLCSITINGMIESLEDMKWAIGDEFNVVNVSINPLETPKLAAAKKANYLKRYGRAGAGEGWSFLTGDEPAIRKLAGEVGFHYAYDPTIKQYAHPAGLVVLTPQGRVSKYLFGVTFSPNQVFAALKTASGNQAGSRVEQLVYLCFCYSPIHGKYGPAIMLAARVLGVATLLGLGWLFFSAARGSTRQDPFNTPEPAHLTVKPPDSPRIL